MTLLLIGLCAFPIEAHGAGHNEIARMIRNEAVKRGVDPSLALAVAWHESRMRANAEVWEPHLRTSSIGIFQVLLPTARQMGFKGTKRDLFRPQINIRYGVQYLGLCLQRFRTTELALCCYNAGLGVKEFFCKRKQIKEYIQHVQENQMLRKWEQ